jgi:hypothetical protein
MSVRGAGGGVWARLAALEHEIRTLKLRVSSEAGGGVPAAPHATEHYDGGDDEVDVKQLGGFPGGSPKTYLDSDGAFSSPGGSSFTNIAVSGQSTVAADQAEDTLTLVAGSNITITTNAGSDSITIAASGGAGGTVGDLLDYQFVRKTSDESVTSSTALQSDDELLIAIGASETWVVEFHLAYTAATAGDINVAVNVPSGATGRIHMASLDQTATSTVGSVTEFSTTDLTDTGVVRFAGAGANAVALIKYTVLVVNSTNAGNVTLRWAQGASSGTATTVHTNSYLEAKRFA